MALSCNFGRDFETDQQVEINPNHVVRVTFFDDTSLTRPGYAIAHMIDGAQVIIENEGDWEEMHEGAPAHVIPVPPGRYLLVAVGKDGPREEEIIAFGMPGQFVHPITVEHGMYTPGSMPGEYYAVVDGVTRRGICRESYLGLTVPDIIKLMQTRLAEREARFAEVRRVMGEKSNETA